MCQEKMTTIYGYADICFRRLREGNLYDTTDFYPTQRNTEYLMKKSLPLPKILISKWLGKFIRLSEFAHFAMKRCRPERCTDIRTVFMLFFEQHLGIFGPDIIESNLPEPKSKTKKWVTITHRTYRKPRTT